MTLPDDLRRVEQAVAPAAVRVGLGHDSHPFGPETGLRLGGIEIEGAPRLAGHSDGDVVLHAVADALLGAAALGDLGRLFPADARTPHGIASDTMLREVAGRVAAVGLAPAAIDVVVIGARRQARRPPRRHARCHRPGAGSGSGCGQREGLQRQPRRRRGGRPVHLNPRRGHAEGSVVTVRLRDTLTGEVRPLEPLEPGHVRIYTCGPTVTDPPISATSGPSCSRISSSDISATAGCTSPGS